MKIGVWLDPNYNPKEGGGYSYYNRLIQGMDTYAFAPEIELCFITEGQFQSSLLHPVVSLHYLGKETKLESIKKRIPLIRGRTKRQITARMEQERKQCYTQSLRDAGIQLVYYPKQAQCLLEDFPFIATNWDIGHRSTWAFPEVIGDGNFEGREWFYNTVLPRALMVICESEAGKEELVRYTHINPNRIRVARLFAGETAMIQVSENRQKEILAEFELRKNLFFYYPAQFWAHKNHVTLLQAFSRFTKYNNDFRLVFTGSDKGTEQYVKSVLHKLGLDDKVVFAGFVSTEEVAAFYRNACALVMPTLMGPTNMPLLEAMEIGCPVICSDFPGHREELGDAALYVLPLDDESICNAMVQMVSQNDEYRVKIKRRQTETMFNLNHALKSLNEHFETASRIRACWGD